MFNRKKITIVFLLIVMLIGIFGASFPGSAQAVTGPIPTGFEFEKLNPEIYEYLSMELINAGLYFKTEVGMQASVNALWDVLSPAMQVDVALKATTFVAEQGVVSNPGIAAAAAAFVGSLAAGYAIGTGILWAYDRFTSSDTPHADFPKVGGSFTAYASAATSDSPVSFVSLGLGPALFIGLQTGWKIVADDVAHSGHDAYYFTNDSGSSWSYNSWSSHDMILGRRVSNGELYGITIWPEYSNRMQYSNLGSAVAAPPETSQTVDTYPHVRPMPYLPHPGYVPGVEVLPQPDEFAAPNPGPADSEDASDSPMVRKWPYWWPSNAPDGDPYPNEWPEPGADPMPEYDPQPPATNPPTNTDYPDSTPTVEDNAEKLYGNWSKKWPFSLPWDLYFIYEMLDVEPQAPVIEFTLFKDKPYEVAGAYDLSFIDDSGYMPLIHAFMLLAWLAGLIMIVVKIYGGAQ